MCLPDNEEVYDADLFEHHLEPPEFKAEAVRLYRTSGKSLREISSNLGISTDSLREWVRRAEVNEGQREGLTDDEREELRRLKRENRILKEECEIMRKATASCALQGIFAKETGSIR